MARKRRIFDQEFKIKVTLEALKGQATINEIASRYQVHRNQVRNWKKKLTENGAAVFERKQDQSQKELEEKEAELYEQIRRLKMELEWLKKCYRDQLRLSGKRLSQTFQASAFDDNAL